MLELRQGIDILSEIGGITSPEQAWQLLESLCDQDTLDKLHHIQHEEPLLRIANAIAMTGPSSVFVNTGSVSDLDRIRNLSLDRGEEARLPMPRHTIHFDLPQEQARIIDRTFYIVNEDERTSCLAKKMLRADAHNYVLKHMRGIARDMTLIIGFFSRGPIGSPAAIPALEITTSAYVMHSADILYRHAYEWFDEEIDRAGHFFTNVHGQGLNRPEDLANARVFMDRSWLTTFSMYCTYAGNTLLLKKGNHRFAVDLATYYRRGRELSEHMFITGLTGPSGRRTYFAGAAPSGCGKTTTAMVGSDFVGDDLAQLWIDDDGSLRAINPECGIFGIVQDVNREGDPYLIRCLRTECAEVIWSNVLIDEDGVPHWVGNGEEVPKRGYNHQGDWWQGKTDEDGRAVPLSHPNSRCTLRSLSIANYNASMAEDPKGVPVSVITYSGRDSDTMPPVWVAQDPDHGVVIGASILSAATATEVGARGVRRQPWANEPFIPGPLADYMEAQFEFFNSPALVRNPIMAGLNYFLTHEARGSQGSGLLGEKRDVRVWLGWLELLARGDVDAIATPIGLLPKYEDLQPLFQGIGKEYSRELYDMQFALYVDNMIAHINLQESAYGNEPNIPTKLFEVYAEQRSGLESLKAMCGNVVTIQQLMACTDQIDW